MRMGLMSASPLTKSRNESNQRFFDSVFAIFPVVRRMV